MIDQLETPNPKHPEPPAEPEPTATLRWPFFADPVIPAPSEAQVRALIAEHGSDTPRVLRDIERRRRELLRKRTEDPFRSGYVPPIWKSTEALLWEQLTSLLVIFGANRSTKTWFAVWAAMRHMVRHPGALVLFLHEDETQSIDTHQKIFHHYLPSPWKPRGGKRLRDGTAKISYAPGDGFAGGVVVLPNTSQARFGFYSQDLKRWEGGKYTLINATERLPLPLLEGLDYRLPGATEPSLRIVWDYTAIDGITQTIDYVTRGAKCVQSERAEMLPETHKAEKRQDWAPGHMPRLQQGVKPGCKIVYFWMGDNPMGGGVLLKSKLAGQDTVRIERRGYGYARNVVGRALPKFGAANIHPLSVLTARGLFTKATRRFIYDPASARNPFMSWFAADAHGRHTLYREWPDRAHFGEWAKRSTETHKWNGDRGPAQDSIGDSVVQQKRTILEAEGWMWDATRRKYVPARPDVPPEEIAERFMDPRAGAAQRITERDEGGITLMDIFADEQLDADGVVIGPAMYFSPAPGLDEKVGLDVINAKYLGYDETQDIVPLINEPLFYVAEECEQSAHSLLEYRPGRPKGDDACKDPFDCVRYYFTADPIYIPPGGFQSHGIRGGY